MINVDGATRLFVIVGDPIAQVKSPGLLSDMFATRGQNALLVPIHVAPGDLTRFIDGIRPVQNIDGIVVTVPHKPAALDLCETVTERARFARSVNVMRRLPSGGFTGDNTDGLGYLDGIAARGFDVAGKRALLVGVGGAGAAIAYEIVARGAALLAVHDVDLEKRDAVIARLNAAFPGRSVAGSADPTGFDLVANATPMGMRPEHPHPVELARLVRTQFVADAITKPEVTPLLGHAQAIGCATMPGLGMLDAQADIIADFLLGQERPA